jgi:hypothetical protein
MTYEVPYWNYRKHVDKYVRSFRTMTPYIPIQPNLIRLGDTEVLVSISDGVDKLIFKDKDHFLLWVIKWA